MATQAEVLMLRSQIKLVPSVVDQPGELKESGPAIWQERKVVLAGSPFSDIPTALEEIRAGRIVVVVDDEDRENEGDLTIAAERITPEAVNFMAKYGRGLICLALTAGRLDTLDIGPMTKHNTARLGTAFTETIDARGRGVTTGISAHDRAETILCAIDPATRPCDLARPGHVFPLRAREDGVLARPGQTEAAVDLTRLAGLQPAGVICEIMNDDGTMARVPDLIRFCERHSIKMITVAELIRYRILTEKLISGAVTTELSTGLARSEVRTSAFFK
jgi:3,4-dihydroxy 2-butanone 4-phosphate synthase / GTP cyclohydrolase II